MGGGISIVESSDTRLSRVGSFVGSGIWYCDNVRWNEIKPDVKSHVMADQSQRVKQFTQHLLML